MKAQKAFMAAVLSERQKSWNKAVANYKEVFRLMYKTKWRTNLNKEKLRLLFFECHFHCGVALQNLHDYQGALGHLTQAMDVVSWRKDDCQAGCITGRVLHLHVPTLARMACCNIHQGDLKEALSNADKAILLDFRNPDLFCIRSVINFLLHRQEKAISDASFAIRLSPTHVCGWLLRGLLKILKKEDIDKLKTIRQGPDLDKACEINPDAMMFVHVKELKDHFQAMFDRFLPSVRVSHTLSVCDVFDIDKASIQKGTSSTSFVCGVAKPERCVRTCPMRANKHFKGFHEHSYSESSISHHKQSLNRHSGFLNRPSSRASFVSTTGESRVPRLTLRDVVNTNSACVCRNTKVIGRRDYRERQGDLESIEDIPCIAERMYSRKWLQDRIPAQIPDYKGCRKLP